MTTRNTQIEPERMTPAQRQRSYRERQAARLDRIEAAIEALTAAVAVEMLGDRQDAAATQELER